MKKTLRFVAFVMISILLLGMVTTAATADTCYEVLKLVYEDNENDTFVYLGEGSAVAGDEDNDIVFFISSLEGEFVSVTGMNTLGKPETYIWTGVSTGDNLLAALQFCIGFESFEELLDECDSLVGIILLSEDADPIYIEDVDDANNFIDIVKQVLEDAE
ncbi:MAG: hypothetical protein E7319_08240 [Clostridiales bacterium]|nr:hypothetical protein [Clostridiales bacterium]